MSEKDDGEDPVYNSRVTKIGKMNVEIYPLPVLLLNQELENHPILAKEVAAHGGDWIRSVGFIAAKFDIEMNGRFTEKELAQVAELCYKLLVGLRSSCLDLGTQH